MRSFVIRLFILLGLLFSGMLFSGITVAATVVEYYNPDLDHYFITADPGEQSFVDGGTVGLWQRTGNTFPTGGSNQVCRFYGSDVGPNSHFYTADAGECAYLKSIYNPAAKSWKFEGNDFAITSPASDGFCPAGLFPVYRAYNKGSDRGIDSNHRITNNIAAIQEVVSRGWNDEGVVMCSPQVGTTTTTPTCPSPQVVQDSACTASCTAPLVARNGFCVTPPPILIFSIDTNRNYFPFASNAYQFPTDQYPNFWDSCVIGGMNVGGCMLSSGTSRIGGANVSGGSVYSLEMNINLNHLLVELYTQYSDPASSNGNIGKAVIEFRGDSTELKSIPIGQSAAFQMSEQLSTANAYTGGIGSITYNFSGVVDTLSAPEGWTVDTETLVDVTISSGWTDQGRPANATVQVSSKRYQGSFSDSLKLSSRLEDYPSLLQGSTGYYSVWITHRLKFKRTM